RRFFSPSAKARGAEVSAAAPAARPASIWRRVRGVGFMIRLRELLERRLPAGPRHTGLLAGWKPALQISLPCGRGSLYTGVFRGELQLGDKLRVGIVTFLRI